MGEAFQRLFDQYYRPVYYFFLRRGMSDEDARDLAQETFFRVYKGMEGYRGDAQVQSWLFQIATNLWKNQVRHETAGKRKAWEVSLEGAMEKGFEPVTPLSPVRGAAPPGPLTGLLAAEEVQVLRQAFEDLPPQMRRCVMLRIDQDLKYREIAAVMQISIDAVKSHLGQARDRLKKDLGRYFEIPDFAEDARCREG